MGGYNLKLKEGTRMLCHNYMKWHEQGLSIREISNICKINIFTIYQMLDKIALENEVTRDDLLYQPHSKHILRQKVLHKASQNININTGEPIEDYDILLEELDRLIEICKEAIEQEEE